MSDDFFTNVDRLRLSDEQFDLRDLIKGDLLPNRARSRRLNGEFLKGPIPLNWLSVAAKLPGKSPLAVALAIMFEVGRRTSIEIVLTTAICQRLGVNRKAKYRGLGLLEEAKLIEVHRQLRRNPVIRVINDWGP